MKHSLQVVIRSLLTLTMSVGLILGGMFATAYAGQTTTNQVTLGNPLSGTNTTYAIKFTAGTTNNIQEVKFQWATTPSGAATKPANQGLTGATISAATYNGSDVAAFSGATPTIDNTNGFITVNAGSTQTSASGGIWIFTFAGIANPLDGDCADGITGTESCFLRITTYSDAGSTTVDTGVSTYTVVNTITATATVDPFMTFTIAGVNAGFGGFDANIGAGTAVTSTTGFSIPFGNLTVGAAKYAMQSLSVRTNAGNGYHVYHKFTTSSNNILNGTFGSNNVDPFTEGGASFGSPAAWASPTGSAASVNSGELGMRTTGVGAYTGSAVYGPPAVASASPGNDVKNSSGPDNGLSSTNTYITYKIEVNAFQPADQYSGTLTYNVVASY